VAFRTRWFSNKIASDDGYSIRPIGRGAILYEDERYRVYVSAERLGSNGISWALYPSDMRTGSEYGPELSDENLRTLIVERIKAAFSFLGWYLDVT